MWDVVAFKLTWLRDDVDSMLVHSTPKNDEDPNSHWRRYFRFTGPHHPHQELLDVLREDGWQPFAVETGSDGSGDDDWDWRIHWFKRKSEPALPPVPEHWNDNDE